MRCVVGLVQAPHGAQGRLVNTHGTSQGTKTADDELAKVSDSIQPAIGLRKSSFAGFASLPWWRGRASLERAQDGGRFKQPDVVWKVGHGRVGISAEGSLNSNRILKASQAPLEMVQLLDKELNSSLRRVGSLAVLLVHNWVL